PVHLLPVDPFIGNQIPATAGCTRLLLDHRRGRGCPDTLCAFHFLSDRPRGSAMESLTDFMDSPCRPFRRLAGDDPLPYHIGHPLAAAHPCGLPRPRFELEIGHGLVRDHRRRNIGSRNRMVCPSPRTTEATSVCSWSVPDPGVPLADRDRPPLSLWI